MILKQTVGAAANFALAANAFMIPSTMSLPEGKGDGIDALKALDPSRLADVSQYTGQIVKVQCPRCELPGGFDTDMSLIMNWTVTDSGKVLSLNGKPFLGSNGVEPASEYNFLQMPSGLPDFLTYFLSSQSHVSYQTSPDSEPHILDSLDLGVHVNKRQIPATDDTDAQLIDVDFHVDDAQAGKPSEIDGITLRVIQDEQANMNILEIVRVPADGTAPDIDQTKDVPEEEQTFEILPISPIAPSSPNGQSDSDRVAAFRHKPKIIDCHGLPLSVCRLQHMIKTKVMAMHKGIVAAISGGERPQHRPCMKGRPHGLNLKGGVNKFTNPDGTPKIHPGPHHHGHHHHHHHFAHRMIHKALRFTRRFFFGFVVPIMIGVAAGMTASLAGMLVGTGLALIWFKLRRGGKRGPQNAVHLEEGDAQERETFLKGVEAESEPRESEDTLPPYEEKEVQPSS